MAKEEAIRLEGVVMEALGNARFKVKLNGNQQEIIAYIGGRLRQHDIKVIAGDPVTLEMSLYDLTRGRIVYRN